MPRPALEIDRLQVRLQACTLPQRAAAIERRMLDAVRRLLPQALAAPAGGTGAQVFIESVEVECAVNAAWDDERIVHTLSRSLAHGIVQALAHDTGRRFADRAEWLAAFLIALADGKAWQGWWFDELRGLSELPASAAMRSVLVDDAAAGVAALVRLERGTLQRVLQTLDDADVSRVLSNWAACGTGEPAPMALLWQCGAAVGARGSRALLAAAVDVERAQAGSGPASVGWIAALADLAATRPWPAQPPRESAPADGLWPLWRHAKLPDAWLQALDTDRAGALRDAIADAGSGDFTGGAWRTPHGGVFTLLVVLGWLRWPEQWLLRLSAEPSCADDAPALVRALCLATVAFALAPAQPHAVLSDDALHRALGIDASLLRRHSAAVARLLRSAPVGDAEAVAAVVARRSDRRLAGLAQALLARLGERVPGCDAAGAPWLRSELLGARAIVETQPGVNGCTATCARAPLHVLLLLAGLTRAAVMLPGWRVALQTEDMR
jgi:hypothetical protein